MSETVTDTTNFEPSTSYASVPRAPSGEWPKRRGAQERSLSMHLRRLRASTSRRLSSILTMSQAVRQLRKNMLGHHRLQLPLYAVNLPNLPLSLDGLRLVQITDVHHCPWLPIELVLEIVHVVNTLKPDLVLLTGDYVSNDPRYLSPVLRALAKLRPHIATVGVLGNHDWWEMAHRRRQEFELAGIKLIDNDRVFVDAGRRIVMKPPGSGLCVAGVGDYWEDQLKPARTFDSVPDWLPRIVLSHNPDVAEDSEFLRAGERVDFMVSGHTHGGQVRLPHLPLAFVPSRYGMKYAAGWVIGPKFPVYVCVGVGSSCVPLRLTVMPEIAIFELHAGREFRVERI